MAVPLTARCMLLLDCMIPTELAVYSRLPPAIITVISANVVCLENTELAESKKHRQ
jgi:hypothetical protein